MSKDLATLGPAAVLQRWLDGTDGRPRWPGRAPCRLSPPPPRPFQWPTSRPPLTWRPPQVFLRLRRLVLLIGHGSSRQSLAPRHTHPSRMTSLSTHSNEEETVGMSLRLPAPSTVCRTGNVNAPENARRGPGRFREGDRTPPASQRARPGRHGTNRHKPAGRKCAAQRDEVGRPRV